MLHPPGAGIAEPILAHEAAMKELLVLLDRAIDGLDALGEPVAAAYTDMARSVLLDRFPQS